ERELTPNADGFDTMSQFFIVTNAQTPQTRVRGFVHDRAGDHNRRLGVYESRIELASREGRIEASEISGKQPDPNSLEIAKNSCIPHRVVHLDERERLLHGRKKLFVAEHRTNPQAIDMLSLGEKHSELVR